MDDSRPVERTGISSGARIAVYVALALFCIIQAWLLLNPDGWLQRHGFMGAFDVFFQRSLEDPIMTAGLIDILATLGVILVIFFNGVPRTPTRTAILIAAVVVGSVYPGLIGLAYLAIFWRERDQFVARGS